MKELSIEDYRYKICRDGNAIMVAMHTNYDHLYWTRFIISELFKSNNKTILKDLEGIGVKFIDGRAIVQNKGFESVKLFSNVEYE